MAGRTENSHNRGLRPGDASLKGFYLVGVMATVLGIMVIFLLNMATPLNFFVERFKDRSAWDVIWRMMGVTSMACTLLFFVIRRLTKPISAYLRCLRKGRDAPGDLLMAARRRLLNLPFIFIPVNVSIWILIPSLIFFASHFLGLIDLRTAVVLAVRASMVGLVASAVGFFGIESHARRSLVPVLFPEGRLAQVNGVARISISRRIRMLYRMGSMVPMTILIVTLFTLHWEVGSSAMTAETYGRGIIIFTLVLTGVFFITTGIVNRLVANSIVGPLHEMLAVTPKIREGDFSGRIRVVSNDEIGVLGDAGNTMIKGLAEREMIRDTFGRYVTPEIRDEILAGRIPLEGERREATVLFADLRGFTNFVESNRPEEVISTMRSYFTAMHRVIRRNRGLVLQFVGDEIEAVFGVPVHFAGHAEAAVKAAVEMDQALVALNRERSVQGRAPLSHGIGIHSGMVLAGNTGSEEQPAYALIGDTVNVASRIQDLTKEAECTILASQETVKQLTSRYRMDEQPARLVKGYSRPIVVYRIYEPAPPGAAPDEEKAAFTA
jgi:adenylate cyclase